jgi:archaellin
MHRQGLIVVVAVVLVAATASGFLVSRPDTAARATATRQPVYRLTAFRLDGI